MARVQTFDVRRAIELYTIQHATMEEIGKILGVSRSAISKALRKAGVERWEGTWVQTKCSYTACGKPFAVRRKRWLRMDNNYCTSQCYYSARTNIAYQYDRAGMDKARRIVKRYFPLEQGNIVHHHDGNTTNNTVANLAVFAHQGDHMRYHHGKPVTMLWDGRTFAK